MKPLLHLQNVMAQELREQLKEKRDEIKGLQQQLALKEADMQSNELLEKEVEAHKEASREHLLKVGRLQTEVTQAKVQLAEQTQKRLAVQVG